MVKYQDMSPEQRTAEIARVKAWNKAHPDRHHAWDRAHPELLERYRQEHPDRVHAADARWRAKNRERVLDKASVQFEVRRIVGETVSEILRLFAIQYKTQSPEEIAYDPTRGWNNAIIGITEILYPRKGRQEKKEEN